MLKIFLRKTLSILLIIMMLLTLVMSHVLFVTRLIREFIIKMSFLWYYNTKWS